VGDKSPGGVEGKFRRKVNLRSTDSGGVEGKFRRKVNLRSTDSGGVEGKFRRQGNEHSESSKEGILKSGGVGPQVWSSVQSGKPLLN
jgi:hypothetical protein